MRSAKFILDDLEGYVAQGYTRDERWNGFACPYFTFEQAQDVVAAWRKQGCAARYDVHADEFIFPCDQGSSGEPNVYPAVLLGGRKFYVLGGCEWAWSEIESERDALQVPTDARSLAHR